MNKRSWILAFSSAVLLHGGVLYGYFDTTEINEGDAKGQGQTGLEVGLGLLGSHVNAQERLSKLIQPKQAEVKNIEPIEAKQKTEVVEKSEPIKAELKSSVLTQQSLKKQNIKNTKIIKEAIASPSEDEREEAKPNEEASLAASQASTKATGRADTSQAGGKQGRVKNFINNMNRWLAKYQRYPSAAKKDKQEGTVRVAFTIDRDGNVLSRSIETSSGYVLLDEAALKVFDDATPLPKVPDDFVPERTQLSMVKPIDFTLITNSSFKD